MDDSTATRKRGQRTTRISKNGRNGQDAHLVETGDENGEISKPMFHRSDWTLFRSVTTLGQKAGVPQDKIPQLIAKELVDNALDAAGTCEYRFLDNGFFVENPGPGLPGTDAEIADLFSICRPLTSSKLLRLPTRGAMGNGLRVVTGAVLATGGELIVKTNGRVLRLTPRDADGGTDVKQISEWSGTGTCIEVSLGNSLPVGRDLFTWAEMALLLSADGQQYTGRTNALWFDADSFYELLQAAGELTVRELVATFDGCSGRKAGELASGYKGRSCGSMTREDARRLLVDMRSESKQVTPKRLGCIGADLSIMSGASYVKTAGDFMEPARGATSAIIPFVVEVWAADAADKPSVQLNVNRTPITADVWFTTMTDKSVLGLSGCNLSSEKRNTALPVRLGRNHNVRFLVNITCPYMPITTDGKSPDLCHVGAALVSAMEKAATKARRLRKRPGSNAVSQKSVILDALPDAIAVNRGERNHRYSERNLYYTVRPKLIEAFGKEPDFKYFKAVIRDHENEIGHDLPGIYRDERGTLYHPHRGESLSLGSLMVEAYTRPKYTFNKVLYSEKEGLFPALIDVGWPERNDCTLLTSKGFASRAARDLIDLIADTDEDIQIFCIHDADGPGTMIYQALQEATKARPARRVRVVNLGLEPEEALAMGLQPEPVTRKDRKAVTVADYVPKQWRSWLQKRRVELNAMAPAALLDWLDRKMEPYASKVLPPADVLHDHLDSAVAAELRRWLTEDAIAAYDVDGMVQSAMATIKPTIDGLNGDVVRMVQTNFAERPAELWDAPVDRLAMDVAGRAVTR